MLDQTNAWTFPIQWENSFNEQYRFRTEIITSRNGTEQRIAQRQKPRMYYDFTSFLNFQNFREAHLRLSRNQGHKMVFPHPRYRTSVLSDIFAQRTSFCEVPPSWYPWMKTGEHTYFLSDNQKTEAVKATFSWRRVNGIFRLFMDMNSTPGNDFPKGSYVYYGVEGYFNAGSRLEELTSRGGLASIEFDGDPEKTFQENFQYHPPRYSTRRGRDFLRLRPQWAQGQVVTFEQPSTNLDLQRGNIDRIFPNPHTTRTYRITYVLRTPEQIEELTGIFLSCRGRAKAFYITLPGDEIRPYAALPNTFSMTLQGGEFARQYSDLSIYRDIEISIAPQNRNSPVRRDLFTVQSISTNVFGDTELQIVPALPPYITSDNIQSINWVVLCRYETDTLDLEWVRPDVAVTTITIRTLKAEI